MRSYRVPIIVTAILAIALVFGPGIYEEFPHSATISPQHYPEILDQIFLGKSLPKSVQVEACATRQSPHGKDLDRVVGCSLRVHPADFLQLLEDHQAPQQRSVTEIRPRMEVPPVGEPFQVAYVYFASPPENWAINDRLVYANESRDRAVVFVREFIAVD